jgi:hypothetical protein
VRRRRPADLLIAHLLDLLGSGQQLEAGGGLVGRPQLGEVGTGQAAHAAEIDGDPRRQEAQLATHARAAQVHRGAVDHDLRVPAAGGELRGQGGAVVVEVHEAPRLERDAGAAERQLSGGGHPGHPVVRGLGPGGADELEGIGILPAAGQQRDGEHHAGGHDPNT